MASRTLSYYADDAAAAWMGRQAALEGRSASQIIGDALRLYRGLPDEARRALRAARHHGREEETVRAAARAILLSLEAANRERVAAEIRASGRPLPAGEDDLLDEAVRLAAET